MNRSIDEAVKDIKAGKMVIITDDQDRENEGDIVVAAKYSTPEIINFMATKARGLICVGVDNTTSNRLNLHPMVKDKSALHGTNFTVSVDYKYGTTTGISAADRSKTVMALADINSKPEDFGRPGHIFPITTVNGGVLRRAGHTEASVELMVLAGLQPPISVMCEIINDDGTMARSENLIKFAKDNGLRTITVADLIEYRFRNEILVECKAEAKLPTEFGDFIIKVFENKLDNKEHVAIIKGDINGEESIPVRVHSECLTGDIFSSKRCDCQAQLHYSLDYIEKAGKGVVLYMRQEGRDIGLINKIKAYALQEQGMDTVEANIHLGFKPDARDYGIGAQILASLGIKKMKLLTNNPQKRVGIESYGIKVTEQIPIEIEPNSFNKDYLKTKKIKMGHILNNFE